MYLSIQDSRNLAAEVVSWWEKQDCPDVELVLHPSHLALIDVGSQIKGSNISLGAQDLALSSEFGAFTGQTAGQHLVEVGCTHAIIGHSEMRTFYGETDEKVKQKLEVAKNSNIHAIVCVGETAKEREANHAEQTITAQLQTIFTGSDVGIKQFSIAYEPRWAISSVSGGRSITPEEAARMHLVIKHSMREFFSEDELSELSILYGGSVNEDNVLDFLKEPEVKGALIGSASAKSDHLQKIVDLIQKNIC